MERSRSPGSGSGVVVRLLIRAGGPVQRPAEEVADQTQAEDEEQAENHEGAEEDRGPEPEGGPDEGHAEKTEHAGEAGEGEEQLDGVVSKDRHHQDLDGAQG